MVIKDRFSKNDSVAKGFLYIEDDSFALFLKDKLLQRHHYVGTLETKDHIFINYLVNSFSTIESAFSVVSFRIYLAGCQLAKRF
jgi:hypothetical protein